MSGINIQNPVQNFVFFFPGSSAARGIEERDWLEKQYRGKEHLLTILMLNICI
jgi:hypothetical protein